jgi:FkbM family methyltransferase
MTRMLWVSNGRLWPSGYGNQTNLFVPRLKQAGLDPVLFAFTDTNGAPVYDADGILCLPRKHDPYGSDIVAAHMDWTKADFSFGLFDLHAASPAGYALHPHAQWVPVDAAPLRPDLKTALTTAARWVIAMSRFGEQVLRDAGFDPLYVPHGIDGKVYRPVDHAEARQRVQKTIDQDYPTLGQRYHIEDKFFVLMNAANIGNPGRKGFYEGLMAFKTFHATHPDSVLYLHTSINHPSGENIFTHLAALGIDRSAVVWPNQYFYDMGMLSAEFLNDLYNAADVLLHPSHAEGFGIPIMEAQMAGCPVIVTDGSAMSELCLVGAKVPGVPYAYTAGLYWQRPQIGALVEALELHHDFRSEATRAQASDRAQVYEVEHVFNTFMLPVLHRIIAEVQDQQPITIPARLLDGHVHRWASTGLFINGKLAVPCLNGSCTCAMRDGGSIEEGIFLNQIGDIEMDIEDDPNGGVSKIIMREAIETYRLDRVDLKPGDVVLDIGAHVGIISIYLAKRFPGVRVFAIEPQIENYKRLVRNVAANGTNVKTIHAAITGDGRAVTMPMDVNTNSGGHSIYEAGFYGLIQSFTWPELLRQFAIARPALIKMDCEGAEYEILEDQTDLLAGVRYFVGEFHVNREFSQSRMTALHVAVKSQVEHVYIGVSPMSEVTHVPA